MERRSPSVPPSASPPDGFEAIYLRHVDVVVRFVTVRLHPDDVDDAVAQTFATAWRRRATSPVEEAPCRAWLLTIAAHEVQNHRRSRRRRAGLAEVAVQRSVWSDHVHIDLTVESAAVDQRLGAVIHQLSDADRTLLALVALGGLDLREAADVLGCSHGAARMRMVRVRDRLREAMRAPEGGADVPGR